MSSLCAWLLTTHRIRKIKCDQKRPFCERCTSTGRQCEGPTVQGFQFVLEEAAKLIRKVKSPSPFAILQPGTAFLDPREQRAFYFFLNEAAPIISGAFDTGFWTKLVPQVSHAEPAVRKAMLTIGQLFDTPLRPDDERKRAIGDISAHQQRQQRAYVWYSGAVNDLQQAMSRGPQSVAMALLSCVLFVCIEYQLHNASGALLLLQNGIALLEIVFDGTHNPMLFDSASSAIFDSVVPFFSRHAMIGATFGHPPPAEWKIDASTFGDLGRIWSSIETLDEARVSLYSLMYQGNAFVRITWLLNTYPVPAPSLVAGQREMAIRVDAWRTNYLRLYEGANEPVSNYSTLTHYLLMYHSVLKVWVATCTSPFQTAFDAHFASFEDILVHAESVTRTNQYEKKSRSPFAAEMGVAPPLFFVVTKCRHPILRRKALALLEMTPQLEGIWKVLPTVQVLRKFVQLEEEAMMNCDLSAKKIDVDLRADIHAAAHATAHTHTHACQLPEEANRIHLLEVIPNVVTKSMSNASIRVLRVVWDANGQRQMREDVVALEPHPIETRSTATRALAPCPTSTPYLDNKYL